MIKGCWLTKRVGIEFVNGIKSEIRVLLTKIVLQQVSMVNKIDDDMVLLTAFSMNCSFVNGISIAASVFG